MKIATEEGMSLESFAEILARNESEEALDLKQAMEQFIELINERGVALVASDAQAMKTFLSTFSDQADSMRVITVDEAVARYVSAPKDERTRPAGPPRSVACTLHPLPNSPTAPTA